VVRLSEGHGDLTIPPFQTRGVESADILAKVMDVDPVPQIEPAQWLTDYRALIQSGEYESDSGNELYANLISHFGEEHPLLVEIDTLKRLQEFRRASKVPPKEGGDNA